MNPFKRIARKLNRKVWSIAYRFEAAFPSAVLDPGSGATALAGLRMLEPPRGHLWADPFPVRVDGQSWILFEDLDFETRIGKIGAIPVGIDGPEGARRVALDLPHHLSYPFIFAHHGELYLVPESSDQAVVERFRCERFPDVWVPDAVLLQDVDAADATLFEAHGRWWMFVATPSDPGRRSERNQLRLYHSDGPDGPWRPHPSNPVHTGLDGARPAGRVIDLDGRLIRPGQMNARSYGRAIGFYEILELTPDTYSEARIGELRPDWAPGLIGTHTFNHADGLTVLDGLQRRPGW